MATTPTPSSKPPEPPKETPENAKVLLLTQEKEAMKYVGKEGHNPFLWIREHVRPLESALHNNPTDETIAKCKSLVYPVDGSALKQEIIN